jgi:hypothetical protein
MSGKRNNGNLDSDGRCTVDRRTTNTMITTEKALEWFRKENGEPSLVVGPRSNKFVLQELLRGSDAVLVTLPAEVWEYDKLYIENVMSRMVVFLEMHFPDSWKNGLQIILSVEAWNAKQPGYWTTEPAEIAIRETLRKAFKEIVNEGGTK